MVIGKVNGQRTASPLSKPGFHLGINAKTRTASSPILLFIQQSGKTKYRVH